MAQLRRTYDIVNLTQYIQVVFENKWRIGLFVLIMTSIAALISTQIKPTYQATATLLIEAKEAKAVSFEEVYGLDTTQKEYYLTQFEILKSHSIAKQVINRLNLAEHPEFNAPPTVFEELKSSIFGAFKKAPDSDEGIDKAEQQYRRMQQLVKAFSKRLSIAPIRKTQMVHISFQANDPELAAAIANKVGEVYIENHMSAKMDITQQAAGWLSDRLSDLRVRLDESEEKLQAYRESENLVDVEGVVGLVQKELEQTSLQLVQARNEQNQLESIVRVINEYGSDDYERLESIQEITSHQVIQDVKREVVATELKYSELAEVYGPKHPKMISVKAELKAVKGNLSRQVRALVTGIEKQTRTATANVAALERDVNRLRSEYQQLTRKETQYHKLKREVETNRNIYDAFLSRSKETEVTSDFNAAVARFIDTADKPIKPIKPRKTVIVAVTLIASLAFAVILALVFEVLNDTIKTVRDIEFKLAQRMLGLLPLQKRFKDKPLELHLFFDPASWQFSEAIRTLRTGVVLSQMEKACTVIEVTSSVPNEGKTTTASNLAFSLAQMENVLLIDADLRRPSIGKRFDVPAYHPGLSNCIAGTQKVDECFYKDEISGLTIMPSGQMSSNPLELLASARFSEVIDQLRGKFDKIIIDTAPLSAVSDALVIARQSDAVIYVVKADSTRKTVVKAGLSRLIDSKANVAGVVLNQVELKKSDKEGAYAGYYDAYGYTNKVTEEPIG